MALIFCGGLIVAPVPYGRLSSLSRQLLHQGVGIIGRQDGGSLLLGDHVGAVGQHEVQCALSS